MELLKIQSFGGDYPDDNLHCPYLTYKESACRCCGTFRLLTDEEIYWFLFVRGIVSVPMIIHRMFSCDKHNEEVGGAEHSPHRLESRFIATDFHPKGMEVVDCFHLLLKHLKGLRVGLYKGRLHTDNRLLGKHRLWLNINGKNFYDLDTQK